MSIIRATSQISKQQFGDTRGINFLTVKCKVNLQSYCSFVTFLSPANFRVKEGIQLLILDSVVFMSVRPVSRGHAIDIALLLNLYWPKYRTASHIYPVNNERLSCYLWRMAQKESRNPNLS